MKSYKLVFILLFLCIVGGAYAQVPLASEIVYPEEYYTFRNEMFNDQGKTLADYLPMYNKLNEIALTYPEERSEERRVGKEC